jgi:arylformamidase
MRIFDITRPVRTGIPVWPGDAPYRVEWTLRRAEGATVNLSALHLSAHTGTHADGFFHASDEGARIGAAALEAYLGPARVVDARGWPSISAERVDPLLRDGPLERILFRTGCWADPAVFPEAFPAIEPAAARALADAGVRLVGTDAPSVDPFDSKDLPTHHLLHESGIANLESLLLDDVPPGRYELIALPLRLEEADASPVRAVLRAL